MGSMKTAAQFNDPTREPVVGCLNAYLAVETAIAIHAIALLTSSSRTI